MVVAALLLVLGTRPPEALAHAAYLGSSPAAGQRVERAPRRIVIRFTEGLNHPLSKATIVDLRTGETVPAESLSVPGRELILQPRRPLSTAPYRVDWFSVSADDGHAEAGQFSFGVRTDAVGAASATEASPLARDGFLRIAIRALFYAALFFFAGGLLNSALLSGRRGRGAWLLPGEPDGRPPGIDQEARVARTWRWTIDAGWLAAALGAALAVAEAADASGGLGLTGLSDYLLTGSSGIARVATVLALVLAALLATRSARLGALACATALAALALAGHANSSDPRALGLLTDWIHLLAAAVWIGGIAQLALTWTGPMLHAEDSSRRAVMGDVLGRFGRVALPAFAVVVASGLANALIELGRPAELWESSYGRVLAMKIGLVALIAAISWLHALRLRPRLLAAADPHPDPGERRRHWLLLRREPLVGVAVLTAAALLVAFPLPPRQLAAAQPIGASSACNPCPLASARDDQLAVADHLGPAIVAVWLDRVPGGLHGRLRLLGDRLGTLPGPPRIPGAEPIACGPGCWDFRLRGRPAFVEVSAAIEGRTYSARLPARWIPGERANQRARRLLAEAQDTMNHLRTLRERERTTSGPGSLGVTDYRIEAPDRLAYRTNAGAESVTIGGVQWDRLAGSDGWRRTRYAGGGPRFTTRSWVQWTPYAQAVRLLGVRREGGRRIAEVALYDQGTPAWWRIPIDLGSRRSAAAGLIAEGHFTTDRYYAFDRPLSIEPPTTHGG